MFEIKGPNYWAGLGLTDRMRSSEVFWCFGHVLRRGPQGQVQDMLMWAGHVSLVGVCIGKNVAIQYIS